MPADAEVGVRIERRGLASFLVAAIVLFLASCVTSTPRQATSASTEGSASVERPGADQALANTIYSQLNADPTYYFRHVEVTVDHGVAHLSGYVWSTDALYAARRIARSVPGVTGVATTQLELERNGQSAGVTR